jgi:hypothetical protein
MASSVKRDESVFHPAHAILLRIEHMILPWIQLENYYGQKLVRPYRGNFVYATRNSTFALLCFGDSAGGRDVALFQSTSLHAEVNALRGELWDRIWAQAGNRRSGNPRLVVTLAINRSSCCGCAQWLSDALAELRTLGASRGDRFIVAARGVYEDAAMDTRTTDQDLRKLFGAGWEQQVLYTTRPGIPYDPTRDGLPPYGRQLYDGLARLGVSTPDPVLLS